VLPIGRCRSSAPEWFPESLEDAVNDVMLRIQDSGAPAHRHDWAGRVICRIDEGFLLEEVMQLSPSPRCSSIIRSHQACSIRIMRPDAPSPIAGAHEVRVVIGDTEVVYGIPLPSIKYILNRQPAAILCQQ